MDDIRVELAGLEAGRGQYILFDSYSRYMHRAVLSSDLASRDQTLAPIPLCLGAALFSRPRRRQGSGCGSQVARRSPRNDLSVERLANFKYWTGERLTPATAGLGAPARRWRGGIFAFGRPPPHTKAY